MIIRKFRNTAILLFAAAAAASAQVGPAHSRPQTASLAPTRPPYPYEIPSGTVPPACTPFVAKGPQVYNEYFAKFYTLQDLESAGLWTRLDQRIVNFTCGVY